MIYQNIEQLIGETPIVKLNKLSPNPNVDIYVKLEGQNSGGSVKDRPALAMINAAEKSGALTKDKIIIEPTSGNTGIGLAMIAAVRGYKIILVMSDGMSIERRKMLSAFGAEMILTPKEQGTDGAITLARQMVAENPQTYWMPDQFSNPFNPQAHFDTTAVEIMRDLPTITHFVAGMGTSGTIMGVSRRLRQDKPDVKIIAVEPIKGHKLQGLKNMGEAIVPAIYNDSLYDQKVNIEDSVAHEVVRRLAREEGIFLGMSSGAALAASLELAESLNEGVIVFISPDRGEKYTSTTLFG
jgi:S-sulfo-L-cysteine synthase (O-acetyl-L-serine-dependent)